jgi:hypothetical protein
MRRFFLAEAATRGLGLLDGSATFRRAVSFVRAILLSSSSWRYVCEFVPYLCEMNERGLK